MNVNSDCDISIDFCVEKINTYSNTRNMVDEVVAIEAPVNIFINDEYVITLLSTPKFKKELVIGWLYDEGVLESMNQLKQISITKMNWNSADFYISEPITLAYSREVGRILAYVPEEVIPRPEYRFYT